MSSKNLKLYLPLMVLAVGLLASAPAFAGSAVIGSVAGSMNATIGGQPLHPNTTVFSGDSVQVRDGVAVVAIGKTSRVVFGRETAASFLRDSKDVTVLLTQGNVSMFHPDDSVGLRVTVGAISIAPASGFRTLGEVAMVNGAVVVTAKEGLLRVEGNGATVNVAKGKTVTITSRAEQGGAAAAGAHVGARISASTAMSIASVTTGGLSSVLSGVALKRAGDAKTAANAADNTAQNAVTAANNAVTAANDATTAANDAATAATNAENTSVSAGCALNVVGAELGIASPFTPPSGYPTC